MLRYSPRHYPVSVDAIESQLFRNRKYITFDLKSSRLVSQEISETFEGPQHQTLRISLKIFSKNFPATLCYLKPGNASGPESIRPEFIIHAGTSLKS